jgi:hypothetical protein
MYAMKSRTHKKRVISKHQAVQSIGDVVHINVYESLTKRLDSIENKLLQIETYITQEPIVKQDDVVPKPFVIESEPVYSRQENDDEIANKLNDLKVQMSEATSDARRQALHSKIADLCG